MLKQILNYLKNERPAKSFYGLDGLRAIAILLVLCHHGPKVFYWEPVFKPYPFLLDFFRPIYFNGRLGVDLFFVLSGFLITTQLLKFFELGKPISQLWRYFASRIFRILPAFYIMLLFVQFITPHIPQIASAPVLATGLTYADIPRLIWVQYLFMQDFFGLTFLPLFWTLGVEEKFYLLAPLLVGPIYLKFKNKRKILLISLLVLLLAPMLVRVLYLLRFSLASVREHYGMFRFTEFHMRCDGLLMGLFCAFLYRYYRDTPCLSHPQSAKILLGLGTVWTLLFLGCMPFGVPPDFMTMQWSGLLSVVGFGMLVLGAVLLPNEQSRWLGSHPLHFVARISYSLYITHFLWQAPLTLWGLQQVGPLFWPLEPGQTTLYFVCFMAIYMTVSIGAATLYFYTIEKPFLLLKDRWFKRG